MADENIAFAHEATVTAETARQMARAMLGWAFRRTPARIFLVALTMAMALLFYLGYEEDDLDVGSRLFASVLWAAAFTLLVALGVAALIYFGNYRNFRQTARPGTIMRTGFGTKEFLTSNDLSSSRFSYEAVRSIHLHDRFVFVRYVGQPVTRVYPRELFPSGAVKRLREAADRN